MNLKKTVGSLVMSLAAASFAGAQEVDDLPYGCEQLEYVESTGTQYIDTGVTPDAKTTYSLSFAFTGDIATDSVFLMGSRKAFRDHAFYVSHQKIGEATGYGEGFAFARGDATVYTGNHDPARHEVSLASQGELTFDGASAGTLASDAVGNDYPVYLFALNNAGAVKDGAKIRLYSCDIAQDGTPVRSFVPVRYLGVPGLYDRVSKRFFTPQLKVDALIAGPKLVEKPVRKLPVGYTQLEYVGSSGHELLDTEIVPDDQTEMYVRLKPHDDGDVHMVGSREAFGEGGRMFGLSNNGGFRMCFGSTNIDSRQMFLNTMVEIAFCSRRFFVYGTEYGDFSSEGSFVGAGPMYVFTLNNNGAPHNQYATIDLAELLILTNGVPARDFVAAMNVQGTPGLYDFVSERFFTCSQGALTAGPEAVVDAQECLEMRDVRYSSDMLSLTLERVKSQLAAATVTMAYGSVDAGDDPADWEGSRAVGAFVQDEVQIKLEVGELPASVRYVRFFTETSETGPLEIHTLVGRYTSPSLPEEYQAAEYLQSGPTPRGYIIDTKYVHRRDTRIECVANVKETQPTGWAAPFGTRLGANWTAGGGYAFFVADDSQSVPRYSRSGDKVVGAAGTFPYGTKVKIVTQGAKAEWFAEPSGAKLGELTTTATVDDGVNTMAIFDLNDSSTPGGFNVSGTPAVMKLYSFRMIDGGHVSRDFIPCLNEYGEPGLYEAVKETFHGNSGNYPGVYFETNLQTTEATYTWTGRGASANWSDAGNWVCSDAAAAGVPGWTSTAIIPSGTWTINIDRPVGVRSLDISAADLALTLSSVTNRKLIVNSNIELHAGSSLCLSNNVGLCGCRTEDFTADGAGCVVEVKNGSELVFDDIVIGGAGTRLVVDDGRVASTSKNGGLFLRTTGNAATDGLWVRGVHPVVSTANSFRPDVVGATMPLHFVVPVGGYAEAPIQSEGTDRCFSEYVAKEQAYASGPTIVYIDAKSPILKTQCSLDVPLVSFPNGKIAAEYTQFESVPQRNPKRESFFYWTKNGEVYVRTTTENQHTLNAHIEGRTSGIVIFFQ